MTKVTFQSSSATPDHQATRPGTLVYHRYEHDRDKVAYGITIQKGTSLGVINLKTGAEACFTTWNKWKVLRDGQIILDNSDLET